MPQQHTTRESWLAAAWATIGGRADVTVLPSYPTRTNRTGNAVHDRVTDTTGRTILTLSPALSQTMDVVAVLRYMQARLQANRHYIPARPTAPERRHLAACGFRSRFDQVHPTPGAVSHISDLAQAVVSAHGTYPADAVRPASTTPRQASRMLKYVCEAAHLGGTYILRISRAQAERGAPRCGICTLPMIEAPATERNVSR